MICKRYIIYISYIRIYKRCIIIFWWSLPTTSSIPIFCIGKKLCAHSALASDASQHEEKQRKTLQEVRFWDAFFGELISFTLFVEQTSLTIFLSAVSFWSRGFSLICFSASGFSWTESFSSPFRFSSAFSKSPGVSGFGVSFVGSVGSAGLGDESQNNPFFFLLFSLPSTCSKLRLLRSSMVTLLALSHCNTFIASIV